MMVTDDFVRAVPSKYEERIYVEINALDGGFVVRWEVVGCRGDFFTTDPVLSISKLIPELQRYIAERGANNYADALMVRVDVAAFLPSRRATDD